MLAADKIDGLVVCIFSKNRAFQLDAAIRSFHLHARDIGGARVVVLYRATDPHHAHQYALLADTHPSVTFVPESNFRDDLFSLLASSHLVMFVVDDTLFTRPFSLNLAAGTLLGETRALALSLRLGTNTTYCYMLDRPQSSPTFHRIGAEILQYEWHGAEHDFGYPLEVSSSLYRTTDIVPFMQSLSFQNPNTLESEMAGRSATFADRWPSLLCFERSVAFSAPLNLVQEVFPNRSRGSIETSVDALSQLFAQGFRLDVDAWSDHTARAAHEEIDVKLVRR